jgi:hypothetical protein
MLPRNYKPRHINVCVLMMETAGIEPASKDIATQASTGVFGILYFAKLLSLPTGFEAASPIGFNVLSSDGGGTFIPLHVRPFIRYTGDNRKGPLTVLKQLLKRNYLLCQLKAFNVLRAVTSTRNLSSIYLCRIRNVPV